MSILIKIFLTYKLFWILIYNSKKWLSLVVLIYQYTNKYIYIYIILFVLKYLIN